MSFLKKVKSLFIVEDEEGDSHRNDNSISAKNSTTNYSNSGDSKISKQDKQKFTKILFKAIEKSNLEGFDYLEFKQSINNLKKQNLASDEKQLFQTAFALAKTMNVSKDSLLQSANHYLKVLESENMNFNDSLENNAKVKLQEKNAKLEKLQETLLKEKEQLKKLQAGIAKHEQQINNLNSELQQSNEKVKSIKIGFETALNEIASQIDDDIKKIKNYIN